MGSVIPLKKEVDNSYLELINLVGNKLNDARAIIANRINDATSINPFVIVLKKTFDELSEEYFNTIELYISERFKKLVFSQSY